MSHKILLIDGNSILNRAFYGVPTLTNAKGEHTNAVYGFLNTIFKICDEENPEHMVVAFDLPKPTFRHKKFKDYKGTRKSMPEELKQQIPILKEVLKKMMIKTCELEGYEADDILGTLAVKYEKENLMPIIVSGDKDLIQIATKNIKIKMPKTKAGKAVVTNYFEEDVLKELGVTPKQFIDVKALMGDVSDNIPGVPGIGEKTALKIILEYKTLDNAIKNYKDIKPKKASENMFNFKEQAILSQQLATIITEVPIYINVEETSINNIFNEEALEIITSLELKSLYPRFSKQRQQKDMENKMFEYSQIETIEQAKKHCSLLLKCDIVSIVSVVEKTEIIGISFTTKDNEGVFVSLVNNVEIINIYKSFFESDVKKITLDSKQELIMFEKINIKIKNIVFDCSIGFYILKASRDKYNYEDISSEFLGEYYQSLIEILGKGKGKLTLKELSMQEILLYGCRSSDVCFRAYPIIYSKLEKDNQKELYFNIELPLTHVLKDMEIAGIKVDEKELIAYGENLQKSLTNLTLEIYSLADEEFNINSPKQLSVILFEKLGLKGAKKTKTGYSTNSEVLIKLKDEHIIISKIIDYRSYSKLKSTYVDGIISVIDKNTGKVHSSFNQTITTTGRISSTEPNLQNIPIRLPLGRELRKVFVPTDESFMFLDGDYSQIELRVLAHMSEDLTLINAFNEGQDIHTLTASQVFNTPIDKVTDEQRSNAKAVNFGIVYGISAFSLSQDLNITKKEADMYINGYFAKYPKVKEYLDNTIASAKEVGYASTIFGRRREIPEINSSNFVSRGFGERVAMNMPIQGSAADIIKISMINVHARLIKEKLHSRIILQIHDELLLEVKKVEVDKVIKILEEEMNKAVNLKVPMKTDYKIGNTWYETK
jgi:DNA polymerase I